MGIHVMKINQQCRVYGRFLTEVRERRGKRSSYMCREFTGSVCAINTGNDIMGHSPTIFCLCKISDGWKLSEEYIVYFAYLIGQCKQQLSARRYHKIIMYN